MSQLKDVRLVRLCINEKTVIAAILLNAVSLFCISLCPAGSPLEQAAFAVDYGCVLFFLLEALFKLAVFGRREYFRSLWNLFDFSIVILSLPVLFSPWFDTHQFAVILVLRLGRLFRLFRLLHFIPNVQRMIAGIQRSLRACIGILLCLCILNLVLALGATFLFGPFAPEHFGNPFLSIYSMFRVFTIEGWYEMPDLIAERAGHVVWAVIARLYFMGSVLGGGIIGLSLANAVFVDEMMMDNNDDLSAKVDSLQNELQEIKKLLMDDREKIEKEKTAVNG